MIKWAIRQESGVAGRGTLQAKENSDKNYFIQRICCSFTSG